MAADFARLGWSLTGDVGDRLRYGDAIALYGSLLSDPATLTGAKRMGYDYPLSWEGLADACERRGFILPAPIRIGVRAEDSTSDEELEAAKARLSPFPGVNIQEG